MAWWGVAGFVAGAAIPCASLWPEFHKRLRWASGGGGGESSAWGEPLFHMVILGSLAGLAGGVVAWAVAFAVRLMARGK